MMSHAGLQRIMDALNDAGKDYGMKINRKKTKYITKNMSPTTRYFQGQKGKRKALHHCQNN